jgi:hypothetical protein
MKTLIAAVVTAVLITLAPVETHASDDAATVLVVRHRWHTGIVLPADRLAPPLAFLEDQFSDPAWYEIGWGDNDFYRRTDNLWLLGKALFWPTDTVLHVVGLDKHPADLPNSDVQALCLSADGLKRLQTTLAEDFKLGDDGQPLAADLGRTATAASSPPGATSGSGAPATPGPPSGCATAAWISAPS